jgi:hypothetical protein
LIGGIATSFLKAGQTSAWRAERVGEVYKISVRPVVQQQAQALTGILKVDHEEGARGDMGRRWNQFCR